MAPDGSDLPRPVSSAVRLAHTRVVLTGDGRAMLLFAGAPSAPPAHGVLGDETGAQGWSALAWPLAREDGAADWRGVAFLDRPPLGGGNLGGDEALPWEIARPSGAEVGPLALAALVREGGADAPSVLAALLRYLVDRAPNPEASRAARGFVAGFLRAVAERDGFVEVLGHPEGGGLFAQGWSLSLGQGAGALIGLGPDLATREAEIAHFPREDLMPPASGFCLFARLTAPEETRGLDALFFASGPRIARLDLVPEAPRFDGVAGVAQVAAMYPRLEAPETALRAFRRIRRPRFEGIDTLSQTPLPVALGIDALLRRPDGDLLAMGWMLDPLARVARVLVKSTANLYGRIDSAWCALPRPDLHRGFGADPRFAGLFDPDDAQHGFVVRLPATPARLEGQLYLELVLDDDSCLFRPIEAVALATPDPAIRALSSIPPREPELPRIIEEHFAPFLADFPRAGRPRGAQARPIPLGAEMDAREVTALVPFRTYAELQPMLALLAATPDAERLGLVLVASRATASETLPKLGPAFDFYGLAGALVIAKDGESRAGRLDAGLAAARSPRVLAWLPSALPTLPGWIDALLAEAAALPGPALVSPRMTYEDGSIHFGAGAGRDGADGWAGYRADRLTKGAPRPVAAGVPDIALIDRRALAEAGGFSGSLFGDERAHVDLARRLAARGAGCFCSGAVTFWKLDDLAPTAETPLAPLLARLDAALIARPGSRPGEAPR